MAIPCRAVGYGNNSVARNVFSATFSTALAAAPTYEAYDGATFPATGTATTTANTIFAGTAHNSSKPILSLVDTSNAAPTSNWMPASATAGGAVQINRMKGTTNYVTSAITPGAGGRITWNMVEEIPDDVTTSSTMGYDLLIRYTYTGAAPTVAWFVNDLGAGGSEGSPSWTAITLGTHGVRHCQSGSGSGVYNMPIPASGTSLTAEAWVTT